jgi:hypothetical protein
MVRERAAENGCATQPDQACVIFTRDAGKFQANPLNPVIFGIRPPCLRRNLTRHAWAHSLLQLFQPSL